MCHSWYNTMVFKQTYTSESHHPTSTAALYRRARRTLAPAVTDANDITSRAAPTPPNSCNAIYLKFTSDVIDGSSDNDYYLYREVIHQTRPPLFVRV